MGELKTGVSECVHYSDLVLNFLIIHKLWISAFCVENLQNLVHSKQYKQNSEQVKFHGSEYTPGEKAQGERVI